MNREMSDYSLEQNPSDTSPQAEQEVWAETTIKVRVRLLMRIGLIVLCIMGLFVAALLAVMISHYFISQLHDKDMGKTYGEVILGVVLIVGIVVSIKIYQKAVPRMNAKSSEAFKRHIVRKNIISACDCRLYEYDQAIATDSYRLGAYVVVFPINKAICSDYISGRYKDIDFRMLNVEFWGPNRRTLLLDDKVFNGNLFVFKLPGRLNKSQIHIYSRWIGFVPETGCNEVPLFGKDSSSNIYVCDFSINDDIKEEYKKFIQNEKDWVAGHNIISGFTAFENMPEQDIVFTSDEICSHDFCLALREQFEERKKHFHLHIEKNILLIAVDENRDLFEPRLDNISKDLGGINRLVWVEFVHSIDPVIEVVKEVYKVIFKKIS